MGKRRGIACGLSLLLLLADNAAWAGLVVKTHNSTSNYWIVRNEDLRRLMASTPNATVTTVVARFGRRPINDMPLPTKPRVRYTVYPECGGRMKVEGVLAMGEQPSVWVDC